MPRNNIKTGEFNTATAAEMAKKLLDRNQFVNTSYHADINEDGGGQPDRIAKMMAYMPHYKSEFDEFQGEYLENGNAIGETYLASHFPLNEVERFDNADPKNIMEENWNPTEWTYKPKEYIVDKDGNRQPRQKYFKYSFDETKFKTISDGAVTTQGFYLQQLSRQQEEDILKYRDGIIREALGEFINRGLKNFDPSDKEEFDPTKEYKPLTNIDAEGTKTKRTYVKDSEHNVYAILEKIEANKFANLDEAEKAGYAAKLRYISNIARPGSGETKDEIIENCKNFIKYCEILNEKLQFAELGRSFNGNETGNTGIDRVLLLKQGILPQLKNELIRNTFRGDSVLPWRIKIVKDFGQYITDDVYGFLIDTTAFRNHQCDWSVGTDAPHRAETRTFHQIIHTDYRQWFSGFRQVHIFRDGNQSTLRRLSTKTPKK